jgi:hypothetical protein
VGGTRRPHVRFAQQPVIRRGLGERVISAPLLPFERVKSTQTGVIDGLGSGIPVLWLGSLYVDLMDFPLQAAGRMFWFTRNRFAGSYFFFTLASRS